MPDLVVVASERRLEVLETPLVVACADFSAPDGRGGPIMHFSVLCGENGWWVEWGFAMEDGDCYADLPGRPHDLWGKDLEEVMELIVETSMRRDGPTNLDEYEEPFGGTNPGEPWSGDWPDWYEWPA